MFFDKIRQISTKYYANISAQKGGNIMNYEVNSKTLAIIPTTDSHCKVIEESRQYTLNKPSFKVIEHSCEYFGVSYRSRLEGSKKFTKTSYKIPIIIEETSRIIFFPVSSPTRKNTLWLSYNNIFDYYPGSKRTNTIVKFKNGYRMDIPISYYSFNNQYLKASRLSSVLLDRISNKI